MLGFPGELLRIGKSFQSLLCWISVVGPLRDPCIRWLNVSILVVLDLGRWPALSPTSACRSDVSILVVLDLGRWQVIRGWRYADSFQSLLCWISVVGVTIRSLRSIRFQSLLCWISVVGELSARPFRLTGRSFNPCCVGSRSLAAIDRGDSRSPMHVSILVVLDLGHWRQRVRVTDADRGGFNPCCVGSRSLAYDRDPSDGTCSTVSILVVLDLGHWRSTAGYGRADRCSGFNPCCVGSRSLATVTVICDLTLTVEFQSLLWWISVIGVSHRCHVDELASFNPCCRGSRSLASGDASARCDAEFQSLLCGSRSLASAAAASDEVPVSRGFNPCCRGSRSLAMRAIADC